MGKIAKTETGQLVHRYLFDTLGAPFAVTLVDSVTVSIDPATGKEMVQVPDLCGLVKAVVRSRVAMTQKLSGEELKFIRKALGLKAKSIADFLEIAPEHLSRCEAGTKVLSGAVEKLFRVYAYVASTMKEPEALLKGGLPKEAPAKAKENFDKLMEKFIGIFFSMKLEPVFDPDRPLHFEFVRKSALNKPSNDETIAANDDGEWTKEVA